MATPQLIRGVKIRSIRYDLDGNSLVEAVSRLQEANTEITREGWQNLRISVDTEYDYGDSVDAVVHILGDRMETAEEAILRERTENQRRKFAESRERAEFERLKAKYG